MSICSAKLSLLVATFFFIEGECDMKSTNKLKDILKDCFNWGKINSANNTFGEISPIVVADLYSIK